MLPLISSFTSASSGPQGSLSSATADMIWPDVQYPHWYPSKATKAACIGCSASGAPRPSIVVISSPSCIRARLRQELTRRPFTCTVHAPHCPWSQPFLVPVRPTVSRRQSSRVVRGSTETRCSWPLIRSVTGTAPVLGAAATAPAAPPWAAGCDAGAHPARAAAAAEAPAVVRNARRVRSDGRRYESRIDPPCACDAAGATQVTRDSALPQEQDRVDRVRPRRAGEGLLPLPRRVDLDLHRGAVVTVAGVEHVERAVRQPDDEVHLGP